VSHIRGPRLNYRLKYWLSTGRLSVRPFIASDEVSWGQLPFSLYFKSQYSTALQYEALHDRLVQRLLAAQAGIVVYIR